MAALTNDRDKLLRLALKLDAVATAAVGLAAAALGGVLDELLGISTAVLLPVGIFLLLYAVGVWMVGSRPTISPGAAWAVIAINLVWVVESVVAVAAGWLEPTTLGTVLVIAQAVVCA
ncbi:MAG TPA: hypothetical protein VNV66_17615, partial [Pilimelia sp.]|nr:hypothetical protein [Pilimelia sp.]